jgi:uncharacterized protein YbjT (DUF2867 family)
MGTGRVAPVAAEDIAAVAVHALTEPESEDSEQILDVTGGELLTLPEQVEILAAARGKAIRIVDVPTEAAVEGLIRLGTPAPVAAAVGQSFEEVRAGRVETVTDSVERLTGRKPRTYASWAREYAARFV